jgi:hypothetical protein
LESTAEIQPKLQARGSRAQIRKAFELVDFNGFDSLSTNESKKEESGEVMSDT